jgi:hypothetical protein
VSLLHGPTNATEEQLSHELALRFATRCYSHLEIAHYKDNFKSLAEHQGDVEYWKEDTLARFLALPESLRASPVIFQMCSYLGAFPFPMLAPCILTREAMMKVITIMTGRYKRILKRGNRDKAKLLFRSLAVFDRRASVASPSEKPNMQAIIDEQKPDDMLEEEAAAGKRAQAGFAIDEPANDGEEEDDDDLALAALDSLDAIEVFKQDQIKTIDRKMNHAIIPTDNFRRYGSAPAPFPALYTNLAKVADATATIRWHPCTEQSLGIWRWTSWEEGWSPRRCRQRHN